MDLRDLAPVAVLFVFITVVVAIGANIVSEVEADQASGSYAENASLAGLEAIDELGSWLPTIALVIAAAVVIGVLLYLRT